MEGDSHLPGGATRIGLTATDPNLNIEVIRADDADGTNAVMITPDAGIPGTTTFLDDPQTVGITNCYRARAILPYYYTGGELSPVVCCTASATPPTDPSAILPTWTITQIEDPPNGIAELLLVDPQGRVRTIEVKSVTEDGASTNYAVVNAPYVGSVALPVSGTSSVVFRITYVGADGADVVVEDSAEFSAFPGYLLALRLSAQVDRSFSASRSIRRSLTERLSITLRWIGLLSGRMGLDGSMSGDAIRFGSTSMSRLRFLPERSLVCNIF